MTSTLVALLVLGAEPFQPTDIEKVTPSGTNDRAVLKGKIPWCTGPFLGETGWDRGRMRRTVNSVTGRGVGVSAVAAIQLCELADDPTWQAAARELLQAWINECGCSQSDAEAQIVKAIAKWKKDQENEGREPTDEEKFAFTDISFAPTKPEAGVEEIKPGPMGWCDGVSVPGNDRWEASRISRSINNNNGIEGTVAGAFHLCWRKDDPTWQQQGAWVLQKWMNWTRQSKANAERSLKARVQSESFQKQRDDLCKELELSPEVSGAEKAFGESLRTFFACSTRSAQTLWEESATVDNVGFYLDPLAAAPNEVVRLVYLYNTIDNPFARDTQLPTKDPMDNASLLEFAVAQRDVEQFDQAALDKMLSAPPYNEYARVVANELVSRMMAMARVHAAAIEKVTKGDADYAEILKKAPRKGYDEWDKVSKQWRAEIERSNAFEAKLGQPSRKVLKGCTAELRADVGKVIKGYKSQDYKAIIGKASTDPIANLLMSRLAVCSAFEKVTGLSGVLADLVQKGRDLRGPRSMAYYAVVDALAEALQDRPKMIFSLTNFYWTAPTLTRIYGEFDFSGSIPFNPENTTAKGVVASVSKGAEGVEIAFKRTSYTYPETICVDDKFHPLKIESNGTITYAQNCKYTGKTVTVNTTPMPIIVAPELATNVKAGVYAVGEQYGSRGKSGTFMGTVHYTKGSPSSKTIDSFYGFDL
ncbi:MAG: hypothetical protein Q8N26_00220 [Myxococcales bacterium]|nr:hypothetical protein [Myxococcales bacterium]